MPLTSQTELTWNEEALASLHERHKGDWRYPQTGWRSLMESDELTGVVMTDKMLHQLACPYRYKDGGTDYENGSGDWVPMSELWGIDKAVGILRQDENGLWTHHPMNEADREAAAHITRMISKARLAGYEVRLREATSPERDASFKLLRRGEQIATVTEADVARALARLRARHTLFAEALGAKAPAPMRAITKSRFDSHKITDENDNPADEVGFGQVSLEEAIKTATAQLKAVGGGALVVDGETTMIHPDQTRTITQTDAGFVVHDQVGRRLSSYAVQGEAIEACTDSLKSLGGGTIVLAEGTELSVPG
jgi:hypothetical protein